MKRFLKVNHGRKRFSMVCVAEGAKPGMGK